MNIMFTNLNINVRIVKINVKLNTIFYNQFNDNKDNYKLLSIFKSVINDDNERMRFRIREIK